MAAFPLFADKIAEAGLPQVVTDTFRLYYEQLTRGHTGMIPESDIEPLSSDDVAHWTDLESMVSEGERALAQTAVLKLNGGLGTSMGLARAKSLIPVKEGLSFLDCAARQVRTLRQRHSVAVPFVLMNSFSTDADTLDALSPYDDLAVGLPLSFLQHKFPKVLRDSLQPASWAADPDLEWNPPGHGDIYAALVSSGMLSALLERGVRYVFISNSDNLGADLDLRILGHFATSGKAFIMEVAERTPMDRKGGHLARALDGRFVLRESAQCPDEDMGAFGDIARHRYFNTNNLWLNLPALRAALESQDGVFPLPLIVNPKTLDPRDPDSPGVFQLETAMGAAIGVFESAGAVAVPRTRFCPVKKCEDLLHVWSDRYVLAEDYRVVPNPSAAGSTSITLDAPCYRRLEDFEQRFPHGAPSLVACSSLTVHGDVTFGSGIVCQGDVTVDAGGEPRAVGDGSTLQGRVDLSAT